MTIHSLHGLEDTLGMEKSLSRAKDVWSELWKNKDRAQTAADQGVWVSEVL